MSEPTADDTVRGAYQQGWSAGLALGALAVSAVAYLNLLSTEKSILAIVLAVLALRAAQGAARMQSWLAIGLAAIQLVLVIIVLVLFHDKLLELLQLLKALY